MRTQEEIIERIKEAQSRDMFGFEWHEYINALTKESAKKLKGIAMKEDADLSDWKQSLKTDEDIIIQCKEYMSFAWEKANNCRGISAGRSLMHYKAWLWMLGENKFENIDQYNYYGKDHLVRICEYFEIDSAKYDDGVRVNSEN